VRPTTPAAEQYARAKLAAGGSPWRDAGFCVVDLETTGLEPRQDEIVSFAAIPVDGGRVRPGGLVSRIVRPRRMPGAETIRIHGLRPTDLEEAPALADVLDELLAALSGRIMVAHVATIERGFLDRAFREHGVRLRGELVDTARLATTVLGRDDAIGLGDLAGRLGLPVHRPHHAEGDALTTAQAFIALAGLLEARRGPQTVRSLTRAGPGRFTLRALLR
jgi:DNA polymerase III subunit epsilon